MIKKSIGYLRLGDYFYFEDKKYKCGHLINRTNGYVACTDVETNRAKRFYIDTLVEVKGEI